METSHRNHFFKLKCLYKESLYLYFLIILFILQLYCLTVCDSHKFTASDTKDEFVPQSQLTESDETTVLKSDRTLPLLLWWTSEIFPRQNRQLLSKIKCKIGECITTGNRKYIKDKRTRAFLFYGTDIYPSDLPLPRKPWQMWALFHEESPLNNYILCHQKFMSLFNITATCRRESDFPLTLQWIPNNDYFYLRKPISLALKNKLKTEKGNAPVLYIQSHCAVPSDRDRYVKELMKYIRVDSYGKCLQNKPIPPEFEDPAKNLLNRRFYDFIAPYKFHLAFENAYLQDYMTEKLFRTLYVGSIPIYKGSPTAKDWMPNNKSVIFVDDFASPQKLAEFIQRLDNDDQEYESYLKYKYEGITNQVLKRALQSREWRVHTPGFPDMIQSYECYVCDEVTKHLKLKKTGSPESRYANKSHYGCNQPYTLLVDPHEVSSKDVWHEVDWIELYWSGLDHAQVVNEMIQNNEKDSTKFYDYLRKFYKRKMP